MKILDRYIIQSFFKIFIIITIFLLVIFLIIDISQNLYFFTHYKVSFKKIIFLYYPFWMLSLWNTILPIKTFISIIFITYRLSSNTEIIAINNIGMSLFKLIKPYFISSLIIVIFSFTLNHYFLPFTNYIKNNFFYEYIINNFQTNKHPENQKIITEINNSEFFFIKNFSRKKYFGRNFFYQKFKNKNLIYIITAQYISWDHKKNNYTLYNYVETHLNQKLNNNNNRLKCKKKFSIIPKNFFKKLYEIETINTFQLKKIIENEKLNQGENINLYLNEYYQRTSIPFSIFNLSLIAFLSLYKTQYRGINKNIIFLFFISFFYISILEFFKIFSIKGYISSFLAIWLPNICFSFIIFFFYYFNNKKFL